MGILQHRRDGTRHTLSSHYVVGRGASCSLRLTDPLVSNTHAELAWSGDSWEVRDLSRNGTYVDGTQMKRGDSQPLARGSRIAFGSPDEIYELCDDSPPLAVAIRADGLRHQAQASTVYLPDDENGICMVFQDGGQWYAEWSNGDAHAVENGDELTVAGETWALELPYIRVRTEIVRVPIAAVRLRFIVSRNEEHVRLDVHDGHRWLDLKERKHWYTLKELARERLADVANGIADGSAGWKNIRDLVTDLRMETRDPFDQHVLRSKRDFRVFVNVSDHEALFDRRTGEVRIGVTADRLEIVIQ